MSITILPAAPSPRAPLHPEITEALIKDVVDAFYGRIRQDPQLGPIFEREIGERWDEHLPKMYAFWSSVMMLTGRYKGRPVPAHARMRGLTAADFERWLALFGETVGELCPGEVAALFREKAGRIAQSLQLALFFDPAAIAPRPA